MNLLDPKTIVLPIFIPTPDAIANWLQAFVVSPGFGGLAAVVAASIAFLGVTRQLNASRREKKEERWWSTLTWVFEKASIDKEKSDPLPKVIAVQVLSELRGAADPQSLLQQQTADSLMQLFQRGIGAADGVVTSKGDHSFRETRASDAQLLRSAISKYWAIAQDASLANNGPNSGAAYESQVLSVIGQYAADTHLDLTDDLMTKVRASDTVHRPDAMLSSGGRAIALEVCSRFRTNKLEGSVVENARRLAGQTFLDVAGSPVEVVKVIVISNVDLDPVADPKGSPVLTWRGPADNDSLRKNLDVFRRQFLDSKNA